MMTKVEPMVLDVVVITYNHVKFIRQALDSVVMQQADFRWRVLIADDCSTDGTSDIVREYASRFPELITAYISPENIGFVPGRKAYCWNVIHAHTRGKYVALLEGDDYWTDPLKLQKQVALLEANPDAFISVSRAKIWKNGDAGPIEVSPGHLRDYGAKAMIYDYWPRTCTKVYPKRWVDIVPVKFQGDWIFGIWQIAKSNYGKVCFLDDVTAVYREHSGGFWSCKPDCVKAVENIKVLYDIIPLFHGEDRQHFKNSMLSSLKSIALEPRVSNIFKMGSIFRVAIRCPLVLMHRQHRWMIRSILCKTC
jgi:glycosyltransferase involved in cell wall biosynthesis